MSDVSPFLPVPLAPLIPEILQAPSPQNAAELRAVLPDGSVLLTTVDYSLGWVPPIPAFPITPADSARLQEMRVHAGWKPVSPDELTPSLRTGLLKQVCLAFGFHFAFMVDGTLQPRFPTVPPSHKKGFAAILGRVANLLALAVIIATAAFSVGFYAGRIWPEMGTTVRDVLPLTRTPSPETGGLAGVRSPSPIGPRGKIPAQA